MPVTKTAKRALRGSQVKQKINDTILKNIEVAFRHAKKNKKKENTVKAISLIDRAVKKSVMHKNKGSRLKSRLIKSLKTPKK